MAKETTAPPKAPAAQKPGAKPQAQPRKGPAAAAAPVAKGRPKGTGDTKPRLKEMYTKTIIQAVMKERGYTNPFQVPRLEKVVINMGVGEGRENAKIMDFATADLQLIFPEIVYDKIDKVRGMDISIVTTARTDEDAKVLLTHLGMPFRE